MTRRIARTPAEGQVRHRRLAHLVRTMLVLAVPACLGSLVCQRAVDERRTSAEAALADSGVDLTELDPSAGAASANESAIRLEELAARLHISLVPGQSGRPPVDKDTGKEMRTKVRDWLHDQGEAEGPALGAIAVVPKDVLDYLAGQRDTLLSIAELLRTEEPPTWARPVDPGLDEMPGDNVLGSIHLGAAFAATSLFETRAGRLDVAEDLLDAAWRLREAFGVRPDRLTCLVSIVDHRRMLLGLRELGRRRDLAAVWQRRLAELQPTVCIGDALRYEAWTWYNGGTRGDRTALMRALDFDRSPAHRAGADVPLVPYFRHIALDLAARLPDVLEATGRYDACRDDPDVIADMYYDWPEWSMARFYHSNSIGSWARAARLELERDFLVRVLEIQRFRRANGQWPEANGELPFATCPRRHFVEAHEGDAMTIAIDRDTAWRDDKTFALPLTWTERLGDLEAETAGKPQYTASGLSYQVALDRIPLEGAARAFSQALGLNIIVSPVIAELPVSLPPGTYSYEELREGVLTPPGTEVFLDGFMLHLLPAGSVLPVTDPLEIAPELAAETLDGPISIDVSGAPLTDVMTYFAEIVGPEPLDLVLSPSVTDVPFYGTGIDLPPRELLGHIARNLDAHRGIQTLVHVDTENLFFGVSDTAERLDELRVSPEWGLPVPLSAARFAGTWLGNDDVDPVAMFIDDSGTLLLWVGDRLKDVAVEEIRLGAVVMRTDAGERIVLEIDPPPTATPGGAR